MRPQCERGANRKRHNGETRGAGMHLAAAALALAAMILAAGCSGGDATEKGFGGRGPVPVLVAKAVRKTVAQKLHAIGRVEAYSTVQIKAQISGEVVKVHFKEGQDVKKGDQLFTIDPRPFEAALRQAEASLAKDQAQMAQAEADYNRYAFLLKQGVGSQQQYDQARAAYEAGKATVAADDASIQSAKLNLAYTQIRSPIDGRSGNLLLHEGNLVKANADTAMVVINQVKPVYVDFSLPEQELAHLRQSMTAGAALPVEVAIPEPRRWCAARSASSITRSIPTPGRSSSKDFSITPTSGCGRGSSSIRGSPCAKSPTR